MLSWSTKKKEKKKVLSFQLVSWCVRSVPCTFFVWFLFIYYIFFSLLMFTFLLFFLVDLIFCRILTSCLCVAYGIIVWYNPHILYQHFSLEKTQQPRKKQYFINKAPKYREKKSFVEKKTLLSSRQRESSFVSNGRSLNYPISEYISLYKIIDKY